MSRRHAAEKRIIAVDAKYSSQVLSKLINYIMLDGKKSLARRLVYRALDVLKTKHGSQNPLETLTQALENLSPLVEVRAVRVAGSNYQVPCPLSDTRKSTLSMKWLIKASRKRPETTMSTRLAEEIWDAFNKRGAAIKIKEDTHKMAEATKSYSHFSPRKGM